MSEVNEKEAKTAKIMKPRKDILVKVKNDSE
jgi:hypothetical protein